MISFDQLHALYPRGVGPWFSCLANLDPKWQIDSKPRVAAFVGQLAVESAGFTKFEENLNYSAGRLMQVWPRRFGSLEDANACAHDPVKLANRVYAKRMGNGDEASGDGWRYRGRGAIQITGKMNYTAGSDGTGIDLVGNPDAVLSPSVGVDVAGWYWNSHQLNSFADIDDYQEMTKRINGGLTGFAERLAEIARVKAALK